MLRIEEIGSASRTLWKSQSYINISISYLSTELIRLRLKKRGLLVLLHKFTVERCPPTPSPQFL